MSIEVADVHNTIAEGLRDAWRNHFFMTDERSEDIRPEYLTTAAVCYAFSEYIHKNSLQGKLTVRAEEQTRFLWIKALLPLFMVIGNRRGHKAESDIRKGNVDISLAFKGEGICELPFGIIETKGFLLFTQDDVLYTGSFAEVQKDLKRNIEFVTGFGGHGIEYAGFTFYLRDNDSVLVSEGVMYCREKERYFNELCRNLIPADSGLSFKVEIKALESNLFSSQAEAEDTDENGCPAHVKEGTWNIIYGIISIYRIGNSITNNKFFNVNF